MKEKVIIHIDSDLLLDFMQVDPYKGIYDEEEGAYTPSHDEVLEKMEEALPEEASLVGYLDTDIESFCMSWAEKEHETKKKEITEVRGGRRACETVAAAAQKPALDVRCGKSTLRP